MLVRPRQAVRASIFTSCITTSILCTSFARSTPTYSCLTTSCGFFDFDSPLCQTPREVSEESDRQPSKTLYCATHIYTREICDSTKAHGSTDSVKHDTAGCGSRRLLTTQQ